MGRKNGLTVLQVSILRAISKRGHLYDGPKQLSLSIFGRGSSPTERLKISANAGLRFIKSVFAFINTNGDIPDIKYPPEYQREFLREIKKSFKNFEDFELIIKDFLNKK